jgi:hypothetical protein
MRASSVIVLLGALASGCVPTQEGMELWAGAQLMTNGSIIEKRANGRHQIMFLSTTGAVTSKSDLERRHFAALDSWLEERGLCKRGYTKSDHRGGDRVKAPDLGSPLVGPIDTRTMQTIITCK